MIYTKELRRQLLEACEEEMKLAFGAEDFEAGLRQANSWASTLVHARELPVGLDFQLAEMDKDGPYADYYFVHQGVAAVHTAIEYFGLHSARGDWHDNRDAPGA